MRSRIIFAVAACLIILSGLAFAELRTYRQFKDVTTKENGDVRQSNNNGDLFEYTYSVDLPHKTITRIKIRRLDQNTEKSDSTVYVITGKRDLVASPSGNGGHAIIAVQKNGDEVLEMSHRFAFTMRTSPFSQVITGTYKRVYDVDDEKCPKKPH